MKSFIVASATLFFFLWVFLQSQQYDMIDYKKTEATKIVQQYAQMARQQGMFDQTLQDSMKQAIIKRTKLKATEVEIVAADTTRTVVCRRPESVVAQPQIHYHVKILIKGVTVGGNFMGVAPADNQFWHHIKGSVSSEKVCSG